MTCMEMTFPSNVHFEARLESFPTAQCERKSDCLFPLQFPFFPLTHSLIWYLSESHFLSLPAHPPSHDPRVLFQQQSITHSHSTSIALLQSEHSPPVSLSITLSFTSSPSLLDKHLTSLCLSTYDPLFYLISDSLCDWQISIILEDLHKSLPSHFLAQMAFDSDHIEHHLHAALIPIFSTDTAKEKV